MSQPQSSPSESDTTAFDPYNHRPDSDLNLGWPITSEAASYFAKTGKQLSDYPDLAEGPLGARQTGIFLEKLQEAGLGRREDLEKMLDYKPVEHLAQKLSHITGASGEHAHCVAESAFIRNTLLRSEYESLFDKKLDPSIISTEIEPQSMWENPTKEEMIARLEERGPGLTFSTDDRLRVQPPIKRTAKFNQVIINNGMKVYDKEGTPFYEGGDHARHFPWFSLTMGQHLYKPEALRRFLSLLLDGMAENSHPAVKDFFQKFKNDTDFQEIIQLLREDETLIKHIRQVETNNETREREITKDDEGNPLDNLMDLPRDVTHDRNAHDAFEKYTQVNKKLGRFIKQMKNLTGNIHVKVWEAIEQDNLRHIKCAQEYLKRVRCVHLEKVYGEGFRTKADVITPETSNLTGAFMWSESVRNFHDLCPTEQKVIFGEVNVRYVPEYHKRASIFDPIAKTVWVLGAQSYTGLFKKHPLCLLFEIAKKKYKKNTQGGWDELPDDATEWDEGGLIMQHSGSIFVNPEEIDISKMKRKGEDREQEPDKIFPVDAPDKVNLKEYLADRIFGAHFGQNQSLYEKRGVSRGSFDLALQEAIISKFKKIVIKVVAGSGTGKTATCVNADGAFNFDELKEYTFKTVENLINSSKGTDSEKQTTIENLIKGLNYQLGRNRPAISYLLKRSAGLRQDDMTLDKITGEGENRKIVSYGTEEFGSYCMDADVDFDELENLPDDDINKQRLSDPRTVWEGDPEEITNLLSGVTDNLRKLKQLTENNEENSEKKGKAEEQIKQELEKIKLTLRAYVKKGREKQFGRIIAELKESTNNLEAFEQSYEELKGIFNKTHNNLRSMCKTDILTGDAGTIDCEAKEGIFFLCERVPHHPAVLITVDPRSEEAKTEASATKVNAHLSSAMAINTAAIGGEIGKITHAPHAQPFILDKNDLLNGNQKYFRGNLDIMPFAILNTGRVGIDVVDKNGSPKKGGDGMAVTIEDCQAIRRAIMRGDYELVYDELYDAFRIKNVPGVDPRKLNPQLLYETADQSSVYFESIAQEQKSRAQCLRGLPVENPEKYAEVYENHSVA
ncbi:hypothetical protein KKF38_01565 [Patescibacteria group bacterium]|nr:hypothetical protein [Patescibacteria group bacterium]